MGFIKEELFSRDNFFSLWITDYCPYCEKVVRRITGAQQGEFKFTCGHSVPVESADEVIDQRAEAPRRPLLRGA